MGLEFVTTLSNVATLIILLGGAIAAIIQFRSVRRSNELVAVLAIDRRFGEPELQRALVYVQAELADKLVQPGYRGQLAKRGYIDPTEHPEMAVCNWFNEMGALIANDFLNEDLFFESYGRLVEYNWRLLGPTIALLRRERAGQYASFEFLARRAERWRANHHAGIYPPGRPRMPLDDPWLPVDGGAPTRTTSPR